MIEIQKQLEANSHEVYRPIQVPGLNYWEEDGSKRIEAKKTLNLAKTHLDKIEASSSRPAFVKVTLFWVLSRGYQTGF